MINNIREEIIKALLSTNRPGIEKLIEFMDKGGFFTAPASTKYHNSYEGGLMTHSAEVFRHLMVLNYRLDLKLTHNAMVISSLLHDLCKIDNYIATPARYIRNEEADQDHATKSIRLAKQFIELTEEEELAILYHMGAYNDEDISERWKGMSEAYKKYPLVYWLHVADMRDSHNL